MDINQIEQSIKINEDLKVILISKLNENQDLNEKIDISKLKLLYKFKKYLKKLKIFYIIYFH